MKLGVGGRIYVGQHLTKGHLMSDAETIPNGAKGAKDALYAVIQRAAEQIAE